MENRGTGLRRPKDKAELMDSMLRSKSHGAFETYRDIVLFCGALGLSAGKAISVEDALPNPIEWTTLINRFGAEELVDLVAVTATDDTTILAPERLHERVRLFESYANGGLELFHETMNREGLTPAETLVHLVQRQVMVADEVLADEAPDIRDIGRALGLQRHAVGTAVTSTR